jgi:hypothetical protein
MLCSWLSIELSSAARAFYPLINLGESRGRRSTIFNCLLLINSISKLITVHLPLWNRFWSFFLWLLILLESQSLFVDHLSLKDLPFYLLSAQTNVLFKRTLIELLPTAFCAFYKHYLFEL